MRKLINSFLFLALFCSGNKGLLAQSNKKIDSLLLILKTAKEDTATVNTLNAAVSEFRYSKTDTAFYLANKALGLAKKLGYEMGIADSKLSIGMLCANLAKYDEGVKASTDALILYNRLILSASALNREKILSKIGHTYNVICHNRNSQGNYPEALKNAFLALQVREEIGDKRGISDTEFNLGNIYSTQHNYSESLKHYYASLKIYEQLGSKADIADACNDIGLVYFKQGNYQEALEKYSFALRLVEEINDKSTIGEIYINLAIINDKLGNYGKALSYAFAALKISEEIGVNESRPWIYNIIGVIYIRQKNYKDASKYLNQALAFSKRNGSLDYIQLSHENWATLYSAQSNYKKALEHYKLAITYRDSLVNKENTKKMVQQQMQYEFDKKESVAKADQEKKDALTNAEISRQKVVRNFSITGAVSLLSFSGIGFYRYRRKKKMQNQQAMMNERLRISRELHDEVGATLSGIAMYSHLAKEQIKNAGNIEVEKSLNIMQQSSGEMVNKLNDIVWLINPEQDSLKKLVERLEEYARDMANIKSMKVKINAPEHLHEHSLPMESRRNIYLFCKEAINNAVKYSNGTILELTIKETNGMLEFTVSDNGKGFDAVMVRRGNGLENMQKRADEIGAKLALQSKQDEGTSLSMQLKIT